ncbi:hypothetical protein BTVI_138697 [Pitangus sulphuratus]|nr:hypothetical protein BTVI_138697 [Pitangus sulphuratus]
MDTIVRLLTIIFGSLWRSGEVSEHWKKANVTIIFRKCKKEDLENYQPVSPTSIPGKVMECLILETSSIHTDDKKVIKSGHLIVDSPKVRSPQTVKEVPAVAFQSIDPDYDEEHRLILEKIENWINPELTTNAGKYFFVK